MSKVCEICGKGVHSGRKYARRGLARAKGGAGRKITGNTKRTFSPNIQRVRTVTDSGAVKRVRVCTECIKTGRVRKPGALGKRRLPEPEAQAELAPVAAPEPAPAPEPEQETEAP